MRKPPIEITDTPAPSSAPQSPSDLATLASSATWAAAGAAVRSTAAAAAMAKDFILVPHCSLDRARFFFGTADCPRLMGGPLRAGLGNRTLPRMNGRNPVRFGGSGR